MEREYNKHKIMATVVILLLLALLAGMVWYDRHQNIEQAENINQETQVESLSESGERESSKDSSSDSTELTESSQSEQKPMHEGQGLFKGLNAKQNIQEFKPEEGVVKLRSIGGILLDEKVTEFANTSSENYSNSISAANTLGINQERPTKNGYDYSVLLDYITPFTNYSDITIAQLGMPAAYPQLPQSKGENLNVPSVLLNNLQIAGIDVLSVASSHIYDKGNQGLIATITNAEDTGLDTIGTSSNWDAVNQPLVKEINGLNIGFLSYTSDLNGQLLPEGQEYLVNTTESIVIDSISEAAQNTDALVVSIQHNENISEEDKQALYQTLSDAGVKLIIGNNLNEVEPAEWLNDGDTLVLHSQANLMGLNSNYGGILEVTFRKTKDGTVKVEEPKFMPTVFAEISDSSYKVIPLADFGLYGISDGNKNWEDSTKKLTSLTKDIEIVTHLETSATEQANDLHRQ